MYYSKHYKCYKWEKSDVSAPFAIISDDPMIDCN